MGDKVKDKNKEKEKKKAKKGAMKEKIQKMKEKAKKWKKEKPAQGSINVSTRPTKNQQQGVADQKKAEKSSHRTHFGGVGRTARGGAGGLANQAILEALMKDKVDTQGTKLEAVAQGLKDLKDQIIKSSSTTVSAAPEVALPSPITITMPEEDVVVDQEDEFDYEEDEIDEYYIRSHGGHAPVSEAKHVDERPYFYSQEFPIIEDGHHKTMRVEFDRDKKMKYSVEDGNPVEGSWVDVEAKMRLGGIEPGEIDKLKDKLNASKQHLHGRSAVYTLTSPDEDQEQRLKVYPNEKFTFRTVGDKEHKVTWTNPEEFATTARGMGVKNPVIHDMLDIWASKATQEDKGRIRDLKQKIDRWEGYRTKWKSPDGNTEAIMTPDIMRVGRYLNGKWSFRTFDEHDPNVQDKLDDFMGGVAEGITLSNEWSNLQRKYYANEPPPGSQPLEFPGRFSRKPKPTDQQIRDRKHWQRPRETEFTDKEKTEWEAMQKALPDKKRRNPNAKTIKKTGEQPSLWENVLTEVGDGLINSEPKGTIGKVARGVASGLMRTWSTGPESSVWKKAAHNVAEGVMGMEGEGHKQKMKELEEKKAIQETENAIKTNEYNIKKAKWETKAAKYDTQNREFDKDMDSEMKFRKQLMEEQKLMIENHKKEDERWLAFYKAELEHLIKQYDKNKISEDAFQKRFIETTDKVLASGRDFITVKGWAGEAFAGILSGTIASGRDWALRALDPKFPAWRGKNYRELPLQMGSEMYTDAVDNAIAATEKIRKARAAGKSHPKQTTVEFKQAQTAFTKEMEKRRKPPEVIEVPYHYATEKATPRPTPSQPPLKPSPTPFRRKLIYEPTGAPYPTIGAHNQSPPGREEDRF
jgi:hypothetical protein